MPKFANASHGSDGWNEMATKMQYFCVMTFKQKWLGWISVKAANYRERKENAIFGGWLGQQKSTRGHRPMVHAQELTFFMFFFFLIALPLDLKDTEELMYHALHN